MVMRAPRGLLFAPLLFFLAAAVQAQPEDREPDPREALKSLLANALQVTINARVLPADEKPIWNARSTRLTLPGRSIRVRMDGENVRIYLVCTPYVQDNGEVLLLAQGQVWFEKPKENEIKYSSTFSSIPVSFGERVLFFPLGITDDEARRKGVVNVEVEIRISPYAQTAGRAQPEPPQQQP